MWNSDPRFCRFLLQGSSSSPGARLHKFWWNLKCPIFSKTIIKQNQRGKFHFCFQPCVQTHKKTKTLHGVSKQFKIVGTQIDSNNIFKNASIIRLFHLWSISVINKGSRGPYLVPFLVVPKSIAICPGVKIRHFGIIESPKPPHKYIKKTKKFPTRT